MLKGFEAILVLNFLFASCDKARIASKLTRSSKRNKRFAPFTPPPLSLFDPRHQFDRREPFPIDEYLVDPRGNGLPRYSLRQFQSASMTGVSVI